MGPAPLLRDLHGGVIDFDIKKSEMQMLSVRACQVVLVVKNPHDSADTRDVG